jgi:mRNA interferase YafQ
MYTPAYTRQFERDVKRLRKRRRNLEKLKAVIRTLVSGQRLDPLHRGHKLLGSYQGRRECHIEGDWLLIYKVEGETVIFERTGTHADLFR